MKILHVVVNYHPSIGGTQILYKGISENCVKLYKDEVNVFTINSFYGSHSNQFKLIKSQNEIINGVSISRFSFYRKHKKVFQTLNKVLAKVTGKSSLLLQQFIIGPWSPSLKKAIDSTAADVISASPSGFLYMHYPLYRHKLKNPKPFVFQGAIHFGDSHHLNVTTKKTIDAIKASEYYLCNTKYEKERLVKLGVPEEMLVITGCATDMDIFKNGNRNKFRQVLELQDDEILIGYIGRLEATKSIDVLLYAFEKAYNNNDKIKLVLAGFRFDYANTIEKIIQSFNCECQKRIHLLYNISMEEKIDLYHALDMYVLPSINESFGIVFLEAWSCKKPVIGTDIGSVASVISNGVDGLLMKPNDYNDLAHKINILSSSKELRDEFGNNGYEKTKANFTWDIVTKIFRETYQKAINKFNNV